MTEVVMKCSDKVQADVEYKEFWENSEHFADLFNGVCFNGRTVIRANDLQEADVESSGVIEYTDSRESMVRTRDIIKKIANGTELLILAIENQDSIDDTMPLRVMVYDGQNYLKDLKHKKILKISGREQYQIAPVITIVIYYGNAPWNGPLCLTDMMGNINPEIKALVSDYKMHLVEVLRSDSNLFKNKDVRQVIEYTQAFMNKDMARVQMISQEHPTSIDVAYMVGKITKSEEMMKHVMVNNYKNKEEENIEMCEFITELIENGKIEGKIEGMILAFKSLGYETKEVINQVSENLGIDSAVVEKYLLSDLTK